MGSFSVLLLIAGRKGKASALFDNYDITAPSSTNFASSSMEIKRILGSPRVHNSCVSSKMFAMTFDDGPDLYVKIY